MNVSTRFRRFILGAGLALAVAGMTVTSANAQQGGGNTISTPGQTSIVTDKDTYFVGEPITITYTLPGPGRIRITDHQGGTVSTLRAGYSNQSQGRIQGTITPPTGKECLTLTHTNSRNVTTTAETCFEVKDKEPEKMLAPGLYTLINRGSGMALDSNTEKTVYSHAPNGGAFQKWMIEPASDGYVYLRDLATSFYLEMGEVSAQEGSVFTNVKYDVTGQHWKLEPGADGHFLLRNRTGGLALVHVGDAIATGVSAGGATADAKFQWKFTPVQP